MRTEEQQTLQATLGREASLLDQFLMEIDATEQHCIYLVSCLKGRFLFVDDMFDKITGYAAKELLTSGLDFWVPLIHPEDRPVVMDKIIQGHKAMANNSFAGAALKPMQLEYKFRRADGEWVWLQESKWIVPGENSKDLILGALLDVTARCQEDEEKLRRLNQESEKCNKLLKVALDFRESQKEEGTRAHASDHPVKPEALKHLTKREKEILQLVGEGLSTKQIAGKLFISINTVETHRRHLLEKLGVKNSMELIKKASKGFWL